MTITLRARTAVIVAAVAVALLATYLLGSSRAGGPATAVAATGEARSSALTVVPTNGPTPGITVTGTGTIAGTPDTLRLDLALTANGASVSSALDSANKATTAVQKALRAHGVADKDVQTSGLSIQTSYDTKGKPNGYRVDESLSVTLRNIPKAGDVVSAAVVAGGDAIRVNGISLDIEDTSSLAAQARRQAFAAAQAKAEQYAKAAGRQLGAVQSVVESQGSYPSPYEATYAPSAGYPSRVPFSAGSQNVQVQVTVVFALR